MVVDNKPNISATKRNKQTNLFQEQISELLLIRPVGNTVTNASEELEIELGDAFNVREDAVEFNFLDNTTHFTRAHGRQEELWKQARSKHMEQNYAHQKQWLAARLPK